MRLGLLSPSPANATHKFKAYPVTQCERDWPVMEPRSLRTLNISWTVRHSTRIPSFLFPDFKRKSTRKPYKPSHIFFRSSATNVGPQSCSSEQGQTNSWSHGVGETVTEAPSDKVLQVVLVSPQIPGNAGSIARTCAASAVGLHLVEPLGFQVDDTKLKRAGLDYWPYVVVKVHDSWAEFRDYFRQQAGEKRLLALTKRGKVIHSDFSYKRGDWLVFGSETSGLPLEALVDCNSEALGGGTIRIPMVDTYVRCLNLSVSVGIALYEAARQLNYEQLQCPPAPCIGDKMSFISEDIFA